jgi:hypothetical protein
MCKLGLSHSCIHDYTSATALPLRCLSAASPLPLLATHPLCVASNRRPRPFPQCTGQSPAGTQRCRQHP